ncbi:MAG: hypothetical protein LBE16_01290 [Clostridiales Family XIII bacterium]|jgi:hypothetical protein|nr:hypothetical protein [Clostridiales Family XIII bacterium]
MRHIFIGVTAALVLLIGLVTLVVVWMANEVRGQIRRRTAELITLYDTFKERERDEEKDAELVSAPPAAPRAESDAQTEAPQGASSVLRETEQISSAHYLNRELPQMYREIRSQFYINPAQVLEELPIADVSNRAEGGPATRLLRRIDYDTAFALSGLPAREQHRLLSEVADDEMRALLAEFDRSEEDFDIIGFCDFLRLKASGEPHPVVMYVPADMFKYRIFSDDIEVVADANICDGVQIEADNLIYDFAIKDREIS